MNHEPSKPIPNSYWVEPNKFLAGEYPGHTIPATAKERIINFRNTGFDAFIDLTEAGELEPYEHLLSMIGKNTDRLLYRRYPIGDYQVPSPTQMEKIIQAIDEVLSASKKLYLHCLGGVGRTGTVVGCYLVHKGLSGEDALRQLNLWWASVPKRAVHHNTPETVAQIKFVINWNR